MKAYLAWIVAGPVMACTCGPQSYAPTCERWDRVQVAFLGTVIDRNDDGKGSSFLRALTLVHVDEAFKGLGETEREVFIDTAGNCDSEYDKGKQYVFYAREARHRYEELRNSKELPLRWVAKKQSRVFGAGVCSGSREASRATDDLSWLRKWRTAPARVYGAVLQNFAGKPWREPFEGSVPLPFAPVSLMGVNGHYSAKTDIDGRYSIESVKPGKYVLTTSRFPWRLEKREEIEITASRPCAMRVLNMQTNGIVRGRVIGANGAPAPGVLVELVRKLPDGRLARFETLSAKTDEQGKFEFEKVPSALFAIGVNLVSPPSSSDPYRKARFERVIEVAPNGVISRVEVKLPPPVK